jgi:hypothetical protein
MPDRSIRSEHVWERGWAGHERAQRRREAALTLIEKLAWLEEASRVAAHLARRVRVSPPDWAR